MCVCFFSTNPRHNMEPGPPAPPTVSQVSTATSPSRWTFQGQTAVAVSNGSADDRRLRGAFSPPQSPTAKAAQRVRSAAQERQASKAANLTRDAARGADGSAGSKAPSRSMSPDDQVTADVAWLPPRVSHAKTAKIVRCWGG